jgi:hypothetical protein
MVKVNGKILTKNLPDSNYFIRATRDLIPGEKPTNIVAANATVGTTETLIWDHNTNIYTYLTEGTTLYVSSTHASDTNIDLMITGLDENWNRTTQFVNTNAQNQAAIPGLFRRVFGASVVGSTAPQGSIYIAEADTLTAGVPNTDTKIKSLILLGLNTTHNGLYTVPAGHTTSPTVNRGSTKKLEDVTVIPCVRLFGGVFWKVSFFHMFQSNYEFDFTADGAIFPEKTDLELRGITGSGTAEVTAEISGIETAVA